MRFQLKISLIPLADIGVFNLIALKSGDSLSPALSGGTRILSIDEIPDEFLKYCPMRTDGRFICPRDFHAMGVLWYMNHSNEPNVLWEKKGLFAAREIQPNEELTLYYPDLKTHPKNLLWNAPYL